jgi:hypothetical protein
MQRSRIGGGIRGSGVLHGSHHLFHCSIALALSVLALASRPLSPACLGKPSLASSQSHSTFKANAGIPGNMGVNDFLQSSQEQSRPWVETPLRESYALSQAAGWYGHTSPLHRRSFP